MNKELLDVLKQIGFCTIPEFKFYMVSKAKFNNGCYCYTENRKGIELNYSDNCKHKFGIGGNYRGMFVDNRF